MRRTATRISIVAIAAIVAAVPLALTRLGARPAYLPDPILTPGETLPVTAIQVCTPGYAGGARNVTEATKREVFRRYGVPLANRSAYEVDHLISLELGGANTISNLWPEPWAGPLCARDKDALENRLHSLVCSGQITLTQAQAAILGDWTVAYRKHVTAKAR